MISLSLQSLFAGHSVVNSRERERKQDRDAKRDYINFCSVGVFECVVKPEPVAYDCDMFVA